MAEAVPGRQHADAGRPALAAQHRARSPSGAGRPRGLRIDTTADEGDARERFVRETLERLRREGRAARDRRAGRRHADLGAVRNDLEKLALAGKKITLAELEREALRHRGSQAVELRQRAGRRRVPKALAIADEFFANEPRAAVPLLSRARDRVQLSVGAGAAARRDSRRAPMARAVLRPIARRVGERRARLALRTRGARSRSDRDRPRRAAIPRITAALVDRISVELSRLSRR